MLNPHPHPSAIFEDYLCLWSRVAAEHRRAVLRRCRKSTTVALCNRTLEMVHKQSLIYCKLIFHKYFNEYLMNCVMDI